MARLEQALALASKGFYVFPCRPGEKLPAVKEWQNVATRDAEQIAKWWIGCDYNIGISTSRFGDDKALVVVDVDTKAGKNGEAELFNLEMQGHELPVTLEQSTPSGGRHIIYVSDRPCKQGVDVLGNGLDIRSKGGFIVGPGSEIEGKHYHQINGHGVLAQAPAWLVDRLGQARTDDRAAGVVLDGVDPDRAGRRAVEFLRTAPVAIEGQGGDHTTFKVACKLKDLGVHVDKAFDLMMDGGWNDRCVPPWPYEDLLGKVRHAYKYGREPQGVDAPEAVFPKSEPKDADGQDDEGQHPFDKLNEKHAYVVQGDHVIWETVDQDGQPYLAHLAIENFHRMYACQRIQMGDKSIPLTKAWMNDERRRTYDSFVFAPEQPVEARWYNLWRGFAVEPKPGTHPSVEAFKEHALVNVCDGDEKLFTWLMGYFAHMIQRPWEKPLVALVFRGQKGTGKNAIIERVGALLGRHFMVTAKRRHLVGQFNGHLESMLCMVLDEAFWSGDKEGEGVLKDLITGSRHEIEHKGKEGFSVKNLTRLVVIGNEKWMVPASHDERRFAVFNVGNGRRQDRNYFQAMREGMEQGGYANLLHYFKTFDLSMVDVNAAPQTQGLVDQKHASLEPVQEWWFDCLRANQLVGGTFDGDIPPRVPTNRLTDAFKAWARDRNIRSRLPGRTTFNETLRDVAPSLGTANKHRPEMSGDTSYAYTNPGIEHLRADWDKFIGGKVRWED